MRRTPRNKAGRPRVQRETAQAIDQNFRSSQVYAGPIVSRSPRRPSRDRRRRALLVAMGLLLAEEVAA